jgi:hypothetical protein
MSFFSSSFSPQSSPSIVNSSSPSGATAPTFNFDDDNLGRIPIPLDTLSGLIEVKGGGESFGSFVRSTGESTAVCRSFGRIGAGKSCKASHSSFLLIARSRSTPDRARGDLSPCFARTNLARLRMTSSGRSSSIRLSRNVSRLWVIYRWVLSTRYEELKCVASTRMEPALLTVRLRKMTEEQISVKRSRRSSFCHTMWSMTQFSMQEKRTHGNGHDFKH